jgi:carboxylate-amine ligase
MPQEDDYLVYTFNRFQACRFGLDGTMVDPQTRESRTIREDILATLRRVEVHGAVLRSLPALEEIERCAASTGNHASHLRGVYARSRNVQSMVQESTRALRAGPG